MLSFVRGGKGDFGFKKCSAGDWISLVVFFIFMIVFVVIATKISHSEQSLKKKYGGINLADSDLIFEGKVLKKILGLGFGGGWVAGALGLGGGVIFNPLLLAMGVPPKVSSATGMYMITFSKISTSILYLVFDELYLDYGLWIGCWSAVGSVIGLAGANYYMKKFGRQSIIVFFLASVMILSAICVPYFSITDLVKKDAAGIDIFSFKSLCK